MLQGPALFSPAIPFSHYPKEKNRRKKKQQINRDQSREADANHGVAPSAGLGRGRATSLPHSIVAIPQVRSESFFSALGGPLKNRQSAR
jgi:hypothetical protein